VKWQTMMRASDKKVRSLGAQIDRMKHAWPSFEHAMTADGHSIWRGEVRPYQQTYKIGVYWKVESSQKPWVILLDPKLTPRKNGTFEEIPHLLFNDGDPELSGLCLFDPDGNEWSNKRLIADTTLPWAFEWLQHYEFWRYDGIWRGKSIGPESIAAIRATTIHRPKGELTNDTA
jgi:hypothetical protein